MKYSIIVPVFNRPDEVDELLESLLHQKEADFEVVIVEDGSKVTCEEVCNKYIDKLDSAKSFRENLQMPLEDQTKHMIRSQIRRRQSLTQ